MAEPVPGDLLVATLQLPGGPFQLRVPAGGALILEDDRAPAVVAALAGFDDGILRAPHSIRLGGRRLDRRGPAGRVRAGLGFVLDVPVAAQVSVRDHLAAAVGTRRAEALLASAPLLAGRGGDPAGVLSGGERRVLAWLRCIACGPRAVVLASAGAGLDRTTLGWAGRTVTDWRRNGVAVLIQPSRPEEREWAR